MMIFLWKKKSAFQELRIQPRLPTGCRVDLAWQVREEPRQASGRCVDISVGGARIEVTETVPVRTAIHLRFLDDLNFEADAVVRHSTGEGSIGVEFTRMMFCGALAPHKQRSLLRKLAAPIVITSMFLILFVWFTDLLPKWRPFTSRSALPATFAASPFFTLGSSRADVQTVQGPPAASASSTWSYGSSRVYFRRDRVIGWSSSRETPLKVGVERVASPEAGAKRISKGSTAADVLVLEGAPEELAANVWRYGDSEVYFRDGRVIGWKNSSERPLKIAAP